MKKSKWCLETREERKKRIRKYNYEMKWKWMNIIYDFNFINSFEGIIYDFVSRERIRRQVEALLHQASTWRSNLNESDNLIMKKRWEKIYEFNINQFILRYKILKRSIIKFKNNYYFDEYYLDYSDSKFGDSDEECLSLESGSKVSLKITYSKDGKWTKTTTKCVPASFNPERRNSYFDDDNWRQREHDTEESFRLAGD